MGNLYIVFEMKKTGAAMKMANVYENGALSNSFSENYFDDLSLLDKQNNIYDSIPVRYTKGVDSVIYKFTVKTTDNQYIEKNFKVRFYDAVSATTISSYVTMDDTSNVHEPYPGSNFFSLSKIKGFYQTNANASSSQVDFAYIYDKNSSNPQTLCSPTDAKAQAVYPFIKTWSTINSTKFIKTSLTTAQYKAATGADVITYAKNAGVDNGSSSVTIESGTVCAVKTTSGEYALVYNGFQGFTVCSVNYKKAK